MPLVETRALTAEMDSIKLIANYLVVKLIADLKQRVKFAFLKLQINLLHSNLERLKGCGAVCLFPSPMSTAAPFSSSSSTTASWPFLAALIERRPFLHIPSVNRCPPSRVIAVPPTRGRSGLPYGALFVSPPSSVSTAAPFSSNSRTTASCLSEAA
jgi:hypothetical protein